MNFGLEIAQLCNSTHSKRESSFDRSGGNADYVSFGGKETYTLLNHEGSGTIRHIWITIDSKLDPLYRKNLILRFFWNGQDHPSVEAPLGDFFGNGWGDHYNFSSPFLACAPQKGKAMVCYFPMPYRTSARIEIENTSPHPVERLYYYVDYDSVSSHPDDLGYFHAWYNQERTQPENPSARENEWEVLYPYELNPSDQNNYLWCNATGQGNFLGVNYYITNPSPMWYGEGDDMFLIDGNPWPGLHGTGTEDYFNTSWSPDELFQHPSFGIAYAPGRDNNNPRLGWFGRTHVYRFHQHDPIRFHKSLRASIEHGHANCLALGLESVAYWYQTLPSQPFPQLAQDRQPMALPTVSDIHVWRDSHRQLKKSNPD